jgi:hypothetical protein
MTEFAAGSAAEVLELAYAVRWLDLAPDPPDDWAKEVTDE